MDKLRAKSIARELVSKMTLEEKMAQLVHEAPAIERLGINEHNWWNEASHGVARAGVATVFPHAIGLAATFDTELVHRVGDAVSTEARAKYNGNVKYGDFDIYKCLTYWTPNINIFRDPRWGRGQETFGEDPYLTSEMAKSYIGGLQGDGEYLKSAACAKHFAVHSGPERLRHGFDAKVSKKDMFETYLPAFEHSVRSGVIGVMGAYNRVNGEPCCASKTLISDILLDEWGFNGYFVSDNYAVMDIHENHKCTETLAEAAAWALNEGCELNCGEAYYALPEAFEKGLVTEETITKAAEKLFYIRALLGEFEEKRPFADIPYFKCDCKEHRELNLEAARKALVLLKNQEGSALPLKDEDGLKIAVIGPNANSRCVLEGNYNGIPSEYITVADGVRRIFERSDIRVALGSKIWKEEKKDCFGFSNQLSEGASLAAEADVCILCLGLDTTVEGEEMPGSNDYFEGGDKRSVMLPDTQLRLARTVLDNCEKVIILTMAGSAVALGEDIESRASAIIHAWYPGALGGLAVAELIAGKYNPTGRLPVTFYKCDDDLPEFSDYTMNGRTYRYMDKEPLYPFGFGLSYRKVIYEDIKLVSEDEIGYKVQVKFRNVSDRDLVEPIQVYAKYTDSRTSCPRFQLCGVKHTEIKADSSVTAEITINKYWVKAVTEDGERVTPDGIIEFYAGSHQPDELSAKLSGTECVKTSIK